MTYKPYISYQGTLLLYYIIHLQGLTYYHIIILLTISLSLPYTFYITGINSLYLHLLRSLLTLGSLPSPHVSDGNGTEGGVDGTEVRWR